jgi:uncharacterized protein YidB (DUF937 family)/outer membrane protein OmpA-like peptidoglycan-associated protein
MHMPESKRQTTQQESAMFEAVIQELATRFGLGDKAGPLIKMVLAYVTNQDTGGISGFIDKFAKAGLGNIAQSWLGGGLNSQSISPTQVETALGGTGGLLGMLGNKLGVSGSVASTALTYLLPAIIGKLTPGGAIPTSLPAEVTSLIGNAKEMLSGGAAPAAQAVKIGAAAASTAGAADTEEASGGFMRWLPWIVGALIALFALNQCTKKGVDEGAKQAATAATAAADAAKTATADAAKAAASATADAANAAASAATAAVTAVAEAIPTGSGTIAALINGVPSLKVYFDSGKTDLSADFGDKAKAVIEHLKANATAKATVSGFNDPTGNKEQNELLSKNRAKAVAAALVAAGIAEDRVVLQKPAETTGTGGNLAEARRVEITIQP